MVPRGERRRRSTSGRGRPGPLPSPGAGGGGQGRTSLKRDTFSWQAREEVAHRAFKRPCCRRAFLGAFVRGEGRPVAGGLELRSRSAAVIRVALRLLREEGLAVEWRRGLGPAGGGPYRLRLEGAPGLSLGPSEGGRRCCRRAWLAGWFTAAGSVSAPRGGYHFEWTAHDAADADALEEILRREGMSPHRMVRRGCQVLSLKRGEEVSAALSLVGATCARLRFEEVRALKETRNQLRRQVNAETANLERSTRAAVRQLACIRLLEACGLLEGLPPELVEVARLRLHHPELSLRELARRLDPPVARATVGRRLVRLEREAQGLAGSGRAP